MKTCTLISLVTFTLCFSALAQVHNVGGDGPGNLVSGEYALGDCKVSVLALSSSELMITAEKDESYFSFRVDTENDKISRFLGCPTSLVHTTSETINNEVHLNSGCDDIKKPETLNFEIRIDKNTGKLLHLDAQMRTQRFYLNGIPLKLFMKENFNLNCQ